MAIHPRTKWRERSTALQQTKQAANVKVSKHLKPDCQTNWMSREALLRGSTESTTPVAPDNERRCRHGQERQRAKAQSTPAALRNDSYCYSYSKFNSRNCRSSSRTGRSRKGRGTFRGSSPLEYSELQSCATAPPLSPSPRKWPDNTPGATSLPAAAKAVDA